MFIPPLAIHHIIERHGLPKKEREKEEQKALFFKKEEEREKE